MKKGKTISIEVEEEIRDSLRRDVKASDIMFAYRVGRRTVARIKQMLNTIEGKQSKFYGVEKILYKSVVAKARRGVTRYTISSILGIPEEIVVHICRHAYAQRRTSENRTRCPTCGNIMTKVAEEPEVKERGIKITPLNFVNVSCVINEDAISILSDLEALDDLGIVGNQLFCDLAMRATKLLDEVKEACDV